MAETTSTDDSYSDSSSSPNPNMQVHDSNHSVAKKRNIQTTGRTPPHKTPRKFSPLSSNESHTSSESDTTSTIRSVKLTNAQMNKFRQRIEEDYAELERSEARYYYYYIDDPSVLIRVREELKKATDGTYFMRPAKPSEQNSNVEYFLNFVCHKRVAEVPICCDKNHRSFWLLSGCGPGSEVRRVYIGIDQLIQHKKENIFHELEYLFQISLYKPIDRNIGPSVPLPDEVRSMAGQNTLLHELVTQGLLQYFNELIRISKDDREPFVKKAQFIVNKINGRNKQGQTPLILAIQSNKYKFVELLLDNKADANITDTQGCSPLHYACRQANSTILKKLIDRGADLYYFNQRETTDGTCQSNLSAFHYLAMAEGATTRNIKRCATHLIQNGCSLMPLTSDKKSPFDIAKSCNNNAYECVKTLFRRYQFNNLTPIEVSSRDKAKTFLSDLACPDTVGKVRSRIKQYDNTDCLGNDGLFLLYRIKRSRSQAIEEFGLCVHYSGQVFIYPISQKHIQSLTDLSNPPRKIIYQYSLITDTIKDDRAQIILFSCREELIYNYTKNKGILPITLKDYVRKDKDNIEIIKAKTLLITGTVDEETDIEEDDIVPEVDVNLIDHFDISQILSVKLLNKNNRRLIWSAMVQSNSTVFPIIIKDYLPNKDIDLFKQYRFNEFNSPSRCRNNTSSDEDSYEFSSRTRLEYKHESELLLNELKKHPFIVHAFICNNHLPRDLRIFMEYLPCGDLHSYLTKLDQSSLEPLINAFHWIYQLAQVMAYLAKKNIVHRDLAARNILLQNENHIKLSDFGLSRSEGALPEENGCIVPPRWTAPECLDRHQKISSSSDVWSFGVLIWEIYSFGAQPYKADTSNNSERLVHELKRYLIEQGRRLSQPASCSDGIYVLMCYCWNGDSGKRPRFVDIVNALNGMNTKKDFIVRFTHEERKAWTKAKEEYLTISQQSSTLSTDVAEYIEVEDNEIIVTQL